MTSLTYNGKAIAIGYNVLLYMPPDILFIQKDVIVYEKSVSDRGFPYFDS